VGGGLDTAGEKGIRKVKRKRRKKMATEEFPETALVWVG